MLYTIVKQYSAGQTSLPFNYFAIIFALKWLFFQEKEKLSLRKEFQFKLESFVIPHCYDEDLSSILIPQGLIVDRVKRLAQEVNEKIGDQVSYESCSTFPYSTNSNQIFIGANGKFL